MAETFYSVLGVEADADAETIRRAYREQVKRHHPDVSDDPGASERFKRLTTARDVLVDDGERSRYDRLGHDDYVRQHVDSAVWAGDGSTTTGRDRRRSEQAGATGRGRQSRSTARGTGGDHSDASDRTRATGYDRTAWLGDDDPAKASRRRRDRRRSRRARATVAGGHAEDWQQASQAYRRADTDVGTGEQSLLRSVASGLVSVGPWLFVHAIFVASAVATAYLTFVQADSHLDLSWPTVLVGVLLLGFVLFASVLHVVSQLYS